MSKNGVSLRTNSLPILPGNREDFFWPFESAFNQIFNDFFTTSNLDTIKSKGGFPRMDIYVDQECGYFNVDADLPGYDAEEVKVEISEENGQRILTISAEHQISKKSTAHMYHVQELRKSRCSRSVALPDYVKGDPHATMKNGVIHLAWSIEKDQKLKEKKSIPIKKIDG